MLGSGPMFWVVGGVGVVIVLLLAAAVYLLDSVDPLPDRKETLLR